MLEPYFKDETTTIYCGDSRKLIPWLFTPAQPDVDIVLTDPPFGIGFAAQPTKWQRRAGKEPETWDNATIDDVVLKLPELGKKVVIWGGNYYPLPCSRGWLCWNKPDSPPSMGDFELAWTNQDQIARLITHSIAATNRERLGHATQKPLAVFRWSLKMITAELHTGGTLFDPFMGVGTALRAAKEFGLKAIGIDISEENCAKAAKRMSQEVMSFD